MIVVLFLLHPSPSSVDSAPPTEVVYDLCCMSGGTANKRTKIRTKNDEKKHREAKDEERNENEAK